MQRIILARKEGDNHGLYSYRLKFAVGHYTEEEKEDGENCYLADSLMRHIAMHFWLYYCNRFAS